MIETANDRKPDTEKDVFSAEYAGAGLRWLDTLRRSGEWELSLNDVSSLLGGISPRTVKSWFKNANANETLELSRDVMERLSLLAGIYQSLAIIGPKDETGQRSVGNRWFLEPNENAIFQGQSMKEYAIKNGRMEALYTIRRYLDRARG